MASATLGSRSGTVTAFDDDRGIGEVATADGDTFPFHCTAIADGSRSIALDTAVRFDVVAGRLGVWEAWSLVPETP